VNAERHGQLRWFGCPAQVGRRRRRDEADIGRERNDDACARVDQDERGAADNVADAADKRA